MINPALGPEAEIRLEDTVLEQYGWRPDGRIPQPRAPEVEEEISFDGESVRGVRGFSLTRFPEEAADVDPSMVDGLLGIASTDQFL